MSNINEMLEFNKEFVKNKKYEKYSCEKYPTKKIAVLSCMDTRLTELLPDALNFKNGDIKIIKNAGAIISHPYGSVMRSLLIAVYQLGVKEIIVIGHHDCGMQGLDPNLLINTMKEHGITEENIEKVKKDGIDINNWLKGFDSAETSIAKTVDLIKNHPLIPEDIEVYGFIMDPQTGKVEPIN